ncbi:uncharacterized protein [Fopius arisanus]|uniref:Uncharacterized protein isoform X1 n=1 Tax=Fopius arisanus TaxID=64838 RepID=A0A9R1TK48_9HYME|nr:PREDICTED: uncharacterized protein LOC105271110 isoform X1 [Fopius arisanus]
MHSVSHICFIHVLATQEIYIMLIIYFCVCFHVLFVLEKTFCGATVHEGLTKVLLGGYTNVRTIQLLNQLCNESQDEDDVERDACYGCFFRASNRPSGYPMLLSMSACADLYLDDSNYGHCSGYLKNATTNAATRATPTTIYCTFLECIRQVNKDNLIRQCVREALDLIPDFSTEEIPLAQLFVNTTACILAKTRCGALNPITGSAHEHLDISKLPIPSINAILINSNYDMNIVQLPFVQGAIDDCAKYRSVQQAPWPSVQC